MTKFNEALDFLEATGNTDVSTIMDCAKCSETVANFALQAYNRDKGGKSGPAQTAEEIHNDKISLGCKLYQEACEVDIQLFKMSVSIGVDPQETIDDLKKKLVMAEAMLEVAEFTKNVVNKD